MSLSDIYAACNYLDVFVQLWVGGECDDISLHVSTAKDGLTPLINQIANYNSHCNVGIHV